MHLGWSRQFPSRAGLASCRLCNVAPATGSVGDEAAGNFSSSAQRLVPAFGRFSWQPDSWIQLRDVSGISAMSINMYKASEEQSWNRIKLTCGH